MTTTVRETLALESFKGFHVLAGFGGLDREISTTTFIEAPDSWKWIRGGECVLTLAYAFQTEEQLLALVRELIERQATCIGIKTERYIKQVPQSVLDLADQHKFPIIDIPISVPFAAIIHPVQSLIIHDQARLLKYSEKVRHTFFGLSVRAAEIEADIILLAKNIDGVYDSDPAKNASAVKFDSITYDEVLKRHLAVMDSTATSLSMDNHIPVLVFALKDPQNIIRALRGEKIGTIVKEA